MRDNQPVITNGPRFIPKAPRVEGAATQTAMQQYREPLAPRQSMGHTPTRSFGPDAQAGASSYEKDHVRAKREERRRDAYEERRQRKTKSWGDFEED